MKLTWNSNILIKKSRRQIGDKTLHNTEDLGSSNSLSINARLLRPKKARGVRLPGRERNLTHIFSRLDTTRVTDRRTDRRTDTGRQQVSGLRIATRCHNRTHRIEIPAAVSSVNIKTCIRNVYQNTIYRYYIMSDDNQRKFLNSRYVDIHAVWRSIHSIRSGGDDLRRKRGIVAYSELLVKRKSNFLRKINSCSIVCHFGFGKCVKCVWQLSIFY